MLPKRNNVCLCNLSSECNNLLCLWCDFHFGCWLMFYMVLCLCLVIINALLALKMFLKYPDFTFPHEIENRRWIDTHKAGDGLKAIMDVWIQHESFSFSRFDRYECSEGHGESDVAVITSNCSMITTCDMEIWNITMTFVTENVFIRLTFGWQ